MGLEIRRDRHGEIIPKWYGAFVNGRGKRTVIALCKMGGKHPETGPLTDEELAKFEQSRIKAQTLFAEKKDAAREKGDARHLTKRLIEMQTGIKAEDVALADLAQRWRKLDREAGMPSEKHLKWCDSVFKRFAEEVPCKCLSEVRTEHLKKFFDKLRTTHTDKTIKDMTILLRSAFNRLLLTGLENPFGKTIRKKKKSSDGITSGGTIGRRPLDSQQLAKLYATARPDPMLYGITVCAACTGLRIGDVCLLKWSSVDTVKGWIQLATSKTGAEVEIPILSPLTEVLESALAEKENEYVFPQAAKLYLGKTKTGNSTENMIYYRGKALFAKAFAPAAKKPQDVSADGKVKGRRVELSDALPEVIAAVKRAGFEQGKQDRILDTLRRVAKGQSYGDIQKETGRDKARSSQDLDDAEYVSDLVFRKGIISKHGQDIKSLLKETRQDRKIGRHSASIWGWHNLRATFITLALAAGIPFETVAKCTGHTLAQTVRDHYYNPTREHTKAAMQKISKALGGRKSSVPAVATNVSSLAAQLKRLSPADRAELKRLL
jgi:integrase